MIAARAAAAVLLGAATLTSAWTGTAQAVPSAPTVSAFPPKANSAWVYDTDSPGTWVDQIRQYNAQAGAGHRLTELFPYGSDLEMYCPDNDGARCTQDDLVFDYSAASGGPARTDAYWQAFDAQHPGSVVLSPIIDGRTDSNGYLQGFDELSPQLAAFFADKVASQVCADPHLDGIQFDLEPFDVSTRNGQYWFYRQIGKDFAGDAYGCRDTAHPRGRFFSVFTFAASIAPHTRSAADVADILGRYGNGYFLDSLYDLSSAPAGTLDGIAQYRAAVRLEVQRTRRWADRLHIPYGFGIPASASAHEYTTCTTDPDATNDCVPDASGHTGYPMLEYSAAAVHAIKQARATHDPGYLGTAVWDFGDHVSWNGAHFGPVPPPGDVLAYLAGHLPGAQGTR